MRENDILTGALLEDACLTLNELAAACRVEPEWIIRHVQDGLFPPLSGEIADWRFSSASLLRARRMRAIERDFDAGPELAALVADLMEELDTLRHRLRRMGLAG